LVVVGDITIDNGTVSVFLVGMTNPVTQVEAVKHKSIVTTAVMVVINTLEEYCAFMLDILSRMA
jgi:hypothetical protein